MSERWVRKHARLLSRLQHNNIVRYYGLTEYQPSGKCALVYELCNASLHETIHNPTIMLDHEVLPPSFFHHDMLYSCKSSQHNVLRLCCCMPFP
eukprot:1184059-Prorocentrum_minimum.AAC.2